MTECPKKAIKVLRSALAFTEHYTAFSKIRVGRIKQSIHILVVVSRKVLIDIKVRSVSLDAP